jgi:hypothetical protein
MTIEIEGLRNILNSFNYLSFVLSKSHARIKKLLTWLLRMKPNSKVRPPK